MTPRKRARAVMVKRGEQMVAGYLQMQRIGRVDLFGSRFPEHVAKRKALILALHSTGLNTVEIARVMQCAPSTVKYYVLPGDRERRLKARMARYYEARA